MSRLAPAIRLLLVALPLNFAWEMLQAPAFTGMPADWLAATSVCAQAAVGDGMIALVLFGLGVLAFRDRRWFAPPRLGRYGGLVLAGIGVQVAVERVMVHGLDRWGYSSRQPVIPVLDVGLLPVLQAVVLLPLTFWVLALTEAR
jgi:hypothetical protein